MQLYLLVLLSEAYGVVQQAATGVHMLTEALACGEQNGEHWYDAEVYRLRGEMLWQSSHPIKDVEQHLSQALDVACRQHARASELRAAMSLCRLWQHQGEAGRSRTAPGAGLQQVY
jgi:hypothetical protein